MTGTVLAIHDDVAMLFALAVLLEGQGIALVPARNVHNAEILLKELRLQPDVLLINCRKRGTSKFASAMLERDPVMALVGITTGRHRCQGCYKLLSATIEGSEPRLEVWASLIEKLMARGHATAD